VLVAAAAIRIVTLVVDRSQPHDEGAGLVAWRPSDTAPAAARQSRRPILYDFTAAWCPPCKRLDAEGWNDPGVARAVGERFVPARIVDRQREDGANPAWIAELQKRYAIEAFPTVVIADASGKEISRMEGYRNREALDEFLSDALKKAAAR
jgi:thiol:disulfide interchange protein